MFRSVDMSYLQILLPSAAAEEFADRMAREDLMQFTDLNEDLQPFQREYTKEIIKIQEIERQVKAIEELLDSYGVPRSSAVQGQDLRDEPRTSNASQIVDGIQEDIGESFKDLMEQSGVEQKLKQQLYEQLDAIRVLEQIDTFLANANDAETMLQQQQRERLLEAQRRREEENRSPSSVPLLEVTGKDANGLVFADQRDVGFKFFAGVVTIGQRVSFERQVFLSSRGNTFITFDESVAVDDDDKIPFVVFFLGDQLKRSLKRLCQFMNIQICYESDAEDSREALLADANNKRNDFDKLHSKTRDAMIRKMALTSSKLKEWKIALLQEKAIRITLNQFAVNQGDILRAEGWCPAAKTQAIRNILDDVCDGKGLTRPVLQDAMPKGSPVVPTHFETNGFTEKFQEIVDTYGVPRYKEFNPTVPTIITFPFLFAVMYGDIFHGSFILAGALIICLGTVFLGWDQSRDSNLKSFAEARYVLLFMGLFAVYNGLVYNDAMSIMINGFNKSQWGYGFVANHDDSESVVLFSKNGVYAFGMDPVWHGLDNQLAATNSLKMKLAVILGVVQMTYGLFLKLSNHLNEGDLVSVFFEFVPQLLFMMSFFGYMCFLIIFKWSIDWTSSDLPATPSLITVLIKMILGFGSITEEVQMFESAETQKLVQELLVVAMLIAVPWMLVFKPLILKQRHSAELRARQFAGVMDVENGGPGDEEREEKHDGSGGAHGGGGGHGHGEEFDFGEIVIHQLIHTIEYVLGTISNTASYLRLWALSLAHSQLAEVFYGQTIGSMMAAEPTFMSVASNLAAQFVFILATIGVLLVMDVLECFLHALRLHWVEFQNKFFYADGIPFKPFSYRRFFDDD